MKIEVGNGLYLERLCHCGRISLLAFAGHSVELVCILYCTLNRLQYRRQHLAIFYRA